MELAEVEGSEEEESASKGLATTMNQHLKSLAGKNYKSEIVASYREAGRASEIKRILSIMWLPNEGAIEKVAKADPEFVWKAMKQEITIAGPAALACLIGFARVEIDLGKQVASHEEIVHGTKALLDSVVKVVELTSGIGKGLKAAAGKYVELTRSMNSRLLPRVRALASHGIRPDRHEGIPKSLPTYEILELKSGDLIDGEAEEILEAAILTDQSGDTV
jgi:DNA recombination protein RmuC